MSSTDLRVPCWFELVQQVAWEFGETVTIDEADSILWEHTGYPSFWSRTDISAAEQCRLQVREFFVGQQEEVRDGD